MRLIDFGGCETLVKYNALFFYINICNKEQSQRHLVLWLRAMVLHLPFTNTGFHLQHLPFPQNSG